MSGNYAPVDDKNEKVSFFYNPFVTTLLRATNAFSIGILGCILFAFSMSLFFQSALFCFAQYRGDMAKEQIPFLTIIGIPALVFVCQIMLSQVATLFSDFLDKPCAPELRSMILVVCGLQPAQMSTVDLGIFLLWFVSIVCPVFVVVGDLILYEDLDAIHDYIPFLWWINLAVGKLLLVAYTLLKMRVYFQPQLLATHIATSDALGSSHSTAEFVEKMGNGNPAAPAPHDGIKKSRYCLGLVVILLLLGIDALMIATRPFGDGYFVKAGGGAYTVFLYILVAVFIWKGLPAGSANWFPFFVGLMFMFLIPMYAGFAAGVGAAGSHDHVDTFFTPPEEGLSYVNKEKYSKNPYQSCGLTWGNKELDADKQMTMLDVWAFSESAYYSDDDLSMKLIENAFKGTALEGVERLKISPASMIGHPVLYSVPAAKTCVMAIRGTHTYADATADGDMWSAVKGMHLVSGIIPIMNLLPRVIVQQLCRDFDLKYWLGISQVWDYIVDFAQDAQDECDEKGYELIVTGHSLGGGLAQIVAGQLNVEAVGWSPVGVLYDLAHFELDLYMSMRNVFNIVPEKDEVPRTDVQIGASQDIACSSRSRVACHSMDRTACELIMSCGDARGRTHHGESIYDHCAHKFPEMKDDDDHDQHKGGVLVAPKPKLRKSHTDHDASWRSGGYAHAAEPPEQRSAHGHKK